MIDTIIMAGSNPQRPVKGMDCKALVKYQGRPMLNSVIDAYVSSKRVGDIYVVGPIEELRTKLGHLPNNVHLIRETDTKANGTNEAQRLLESARCGLTARYYSKPEKKPYVLFSACDIPRIRPEHIDNFLKYAHLSVLDQGKKGIDLDVILSVVDVKDELTQFKGMTKKQRPGIPLREGSFRLGNIAYVNTDNLLGKIDKVEFAYSQRKGREHKLRTAWQIFGAIGLKELLLHWRLPSIDQVRQRVSEVYEMNIDALIVEPEVAADADNDEDFDGLIRGE